MAISTVPPTTVTINLTEGPRAGFAQLVTRCKESDKADIDKAAKLIGLTQADFLRTVLINSARKIIAEMGS